MLDQDFIVVEAKKELARREFYEYCRLKYPNFYRKERQYLKDVCDTLQRFSEQNEKRILVMNMPPRHGKSFTAQNFTEWNFGKNPSAKIMTGSYNETLSTTFARKVRDTIVEKSTGGKVVYNDVFPDTKIKYGEASASIWSLEGKDEKSYLATSPTGTATGFGAHIIMIDDVIKNDDEAYNEALLDRHFDWFTNTMLSRTEGDSWKLIIIMTRWSTRDLAGRVLEAFDPSEIEHISFQAYDGEQMLCDDILNLNDYRLKTRNMNPDIVAANYNQEPIDVKGRMFEAFQEYETLPEGATHVANYTDTADKGTDYLCSVNYTTDNGIVYVTDLIMSDEAMETTEPQVADLLTRGGVNEAYIESNNGGRGFGRNLDRLLKERGNLKTVIAPFTQTSNKESRILSSSAWLQNNLRMPLNWRTKYPVFYNQVMSYQKKGKNKHDDAVDVLAGIYEKVANAYVYEWVAPDF